jgi:hypothetical protein
LSGDKSEKVDLIIAEFLKDESGLEMKKNEVLELLLAARQRPLTLPEHRKLDQLRREIKADMAAAPNEAHPSVANLNEAARYLRAQGWKLGKSRIYKDHSAGKLAPGSDGRYLHAALDQYALANLTRSDGSPVTAGDNELARLQRESIEEELAHRKITRQRAELKFDRERGLLIPRDAFETEIAARAAVFRSDYENFCYMRAPEIIDTVAGDQARAPELITLMLAAGEIWFSRYAEEREIRLEPAASAPSASPDEDDIDPEDSEEEGENL